MWDTKKFETPVDCLSLVETYVVNNEIKENTVGGTCMEFNADAGANKFLIGTE